MPDPTVGTFRFDDGDGNEWFLVPPVTNSGDELRSKCVKPLHVTGKLTAGSFQVYGYGPSDPIDVQALRDGTGSSAGPKTIPDTTVVTQCARIPINVANCAQHTVRIAGTWDGSGTKDRIDTVVYEVAKQGCRR